VSRPTENGAFRCFKKAAPFSVACGAIFHNLLKQQKIAPGLDTESARNTIKNRLCCAIKRYLPLQRPVSWYGRDGSNPKRAESHGGKPVGGPRCESALRVGGLRAKQVPQTPTTNGIHHAGGCGAAVKSRRESKKARGTPNPGDRLRGKPQNPAAPLSAAAGSGGGRYDYPLCKEVYNAFVCRTLSVLS